MAIAGVEPIGYTETPVRNILVKLLTNMSIEDVDGLSTLKAIPDSSLVTEQSERLVDEFIGNTEESNTNIVKSGLSSIDLPVGTPLYTEEQISGILIKFAESIDVEPDIVYNWEEEPEILGYDLVVENTIVRGCEDMELAIDEFMKMGD